MSTLRGEMIWVCCRCQHTNVKLDHPFQCSRDRHDRCKNCVVSRRPSRSSGVAQSGPDKYLDSLRLPGSQGYERWESTADRFDEPRFTGREFFMKDLQLPKQDFHGKKVGQSPNTKLTRESERAGGVPIGIDPEPPARVLSAVAAHISQDLGDHAIAAELLQEVTSLLYVYWRALLQIAGLASDDAFVRRLENLSMATADALMRRHVSPRPDITLDPYIRLMIDQSTRRMPYHHLSARSQTFLFENTEYECLISRLKCYITTKSAGYISSDTRLRFASQMDTSGSIELRLHWDSIKFLNEQYGVSHSQKLADCICIVGTSMNAYASTCLEYLQLVSPTVGTSTLHLLDDWAAQKDLCSSHVYGDDKNDFSLIFRLFFNRKGAILACTVRSKVFSCIVEVCETLCWLSIACRCSPLDGRGRGYPQSCLPLVSPSKHRDLLLSDSLAISILAGFEGQAREERTDNNGTCWHSIFRDMTIASGYPIPTRDDGIQGLQISLGLMSSLTMITRAMMYGDILMLKGLCNMFVPTLLHKKSVVWHYILEEDFTALSHNKAREVCKAIASIALEDLSSFEMHYVGWTTSSQLNLGRAATKYDHIGFTGSDIVGPGLVIDGFTVNVSKYIGGSVKFQPAQKDSRLLHATAGPYERVVNAAHKMDVVIYDISTQRGWLLGGDDALLYLSRAALSHPEGLNPPPDGQGQLAKDLFQHVDFSAQGLEASKDVLLHQGNRKLIVYDNAEDPSRAWRFEDEVLAIFEVLHEIQSHRARLRSCETKQWEIRNPLARRFVGIGCLDIISGVTGLQSRCREIKDSGARWLKLADAIDTVNIIGAGIDDLITSSLNQSNVFVSPPPNLDVLTTSAKQLARIARRYGHMDANCVELAEGIFWIDPHSAFHSHPCKCQEEGLACCCSEEVVELGDSRQTSASEGGRMRLATIVATHPTAAVILGSKASAMRLLQSPGFVAKAKPPISTVPKWSANLKWKSWFKK